VLRRSFRFSGGTNEGCGARDQVISAIAGRRKEIPELKWEIKDVLVLGDRVVVRSEASATPAGDFLGVTYGGKSFKLMSIDVHTIEAVNTTSAAETEISLAPPRR
jgi:predicted ester cyclase